MVRSYQHRSKARPPTKRNKKKEEREVKQLIRSDEKTTGDSLREAVDGTIITSETDEVSRADQAGSIETRGQRSLVDGARERQRALRNYVFLPLLFLTVALMGGLRLASADSAFVFMPPALVCLFLAVVLIVLFVRGRLIAFDTWFSEDHSTLHNISNGILLLTLFAATTQVFNSVLPETGLPFWVVSFCFAWSLWNNLFAELDNKKLLKSVIALLAFAFVAKYIVLAGLTAPAGESGWLRSMIENPAKETITWLLELPRYSAGTGYIQFFCLLFYFAGLYMLPRSAK